MVKRIGGNKKANSLSIHFQSAFHNVAAVVVQHFLFFCNVCALSLLLPEVPSVSVRFGLGWAGQGLGRGSGAGKKPHRLPSVQLHPCATSNSPVMTSTHQPQHTHTHTLIHSTCIYIHGPPASCFSKRHTDAGGKLGPRLWCASPRQPLCLTATREDGTEPTQNALEPSGGKVSTAPSRPSEEKKPTCRSEDCLLLDIFFPLTSSSSPLQKNSYFQAA